jgi:hypothetical protein
MFFNTDEEVVVFVDNTGTETISLRVRDFGQEGHDHSYPLSAGANVFRMKGTGFGICKLLYP